MCRTSPHIAGTFSIASGPSCPLVYGRFFPAFFSSRAEIGLAASISAEGRSLVVVANKTDAMSSTDRFRVRNLFWHGGKIQEAHAAYFTQQLVGAARAKIRAVGAGAGGVSTSHPTSILTRESLKPLQTVVAVLGEKLRSIRRSCRGGRCRIFSS